MISSYARGHKIYYDNINKVWKYVDDNTSLDDNSRTCKNCRHSPTKEGYDYCLGHIQGVKSACCGHGIEKPYIMK